MANIHRLIVLLFLSFFSFNSFAAFSVPSSTTYRLGFPTLANVFATVNSLDDENHTLMYEVIFDNGWGVLLSGSKACLPVLGYYETKRTQSIFADDVPCGLQDMLENYKQQIALSFANDSIRLYDQKEWRQLLET